ncbi:MAG: methyltransferase domain-containing protein [Proteobacteria bacterium]|nr:methyltransferase domain-containing protein [Pseudomonadota bacterium]
MDDGYFEKLASDLQAKRDRLARACAGLGFGVAPCAGTYFLTLDVAPLGREADDVVLEVGTGSGYQAAVLAEIVKEVYSIEIVPELGKRAARVLDALGYANVHTRIGDGYKGWPDRAPFDGIIVTAAPDHVPQPLIDQLKIGGRMVIPVGPRDRVQELKLLEKQEDGSVKTTTLDLVRFVPMTGEAEKNKK